MTTRTYYMPRNRISVHLMNYMVARIGCSIGDIKVLKDTNMFRVPITCNDKDVSKVEKILYRYDMLGE